MESSTKEMSEQGKIKNGLRYSEVKFQGNGKEYFSIWIVNLLLTIVTLGIYSAWAKVRTNQYFYSNLEIDGHRLSYLAQPRQILIGRIIGFLTFGSFYLASAFSPILALIIGLVLFAALPFIICQSIKFNMRMTGYRNIRFGFNGKYGQAFFVFFICPLIGIFTLYLALPWILKKIDEFTISNMTLGKKTFSTNLEAIEYFKTTLSAVCIGIVVILVAALGVGFTMAAYSGELQVFSWSMSFIITYVIVFLLSSSFFSARIRNYRFSKSQIQDVAGFESRVTFRGLLQLRVTNFLLLCVTLGFAWPWTKIRSAHFYALATRVALYAGADEIIADSEESASAIGDEVAEAFDVGVVLG